MLKLLTYTIFGMLIVISIYFFAKTSYTSEKGYLLRENQLKQKELESTNRILKQRALDAQSLKELKRSDVVKEMQEPESKIYVKPKSPLTQKK